MAEVRTIEEFIRGPDGDEARGVRPKLIKAIDAAKEAGIKRIQVEIRVTPSGTSSSRQEDWTTFATEDPVSAVETALQKMLEETPGNAFTGEVRLNFKEHGNASNHLGSYTKQLRPGVSPDGVADGGARFGDLGAVMAHFNSVVKPQGDFIIRLLDSCANMANACAKVTEAAKPPPKVRYEGGKGDGMIPDLLKGVLMLADEAKDEPTQQAIIVQQAPPTSSAPPPLPPGLRGTAPPTPPPPAPPAAPPAPATPPAPKVDEAAVREWLDKHPARALFIGREMANKLGFDVVQT